MPSTPPHQAKGVFGLFCLASYLLSLSYGSTFLLAMMLSAHGGSESQAGTIISVAMLSTFLAVIFSGHLTDLFGATRAIACGSLLLAAACLGFATLPGPISRRRSPALALMERKIRSITPASCRKF